MSRGKEVSLIVSRGKKEVSLCLGAKRCPCVVDETLR